MGEASCRRKGSRLPFRPMNAPWSHAEAEPEIALVLLEALRTSDTPTRTLEAEDFSQSLPRRLGLNEVVSRQIQRYETLRKRKRKLDASELADLYRLVDRRPDAGNVFARAGTILAEDHLQGRPLPARLVSRILPEALSRRSAARALEKLAGRVNPGSTVQRELRPLTLVVEGSLPAGASGNSSGCRLLQSALETMASHYLGVEAPGAHPLCEARGDGTCLWRTREERPGAPDGG